MSIVSDQNVNHFRFFIKRSLSDLDVHNQHEPAEDEQQNKMTVKRCPRLFGASWLAIRVRERTHLLLRDTHPRTFSGSLAVGQRRTFVFFFV